MCTLPSDPFVESFYSLKKAFLRLQSTDGSSFNIARPSFASPILMTSSSTIRAANIAMPVTSKIKFNLPAPKETLTAHRNQIGRWSGWCPWGWSGWVLASSFTCFHWSALTRNVYHIIGDTDIDAPSSHLPTSPPIAPGLNVGLMSAETTAACEILLNLFAIKLILIFTHSNLTVNLVEGPVEGAVDILQHSSPILTGSCLLQTFLLPFW